jgi:fucose permease
VQDDRQAARRILAAGLVTFVLMGFGQSLFGPTLPEATRQFSLAEGQAALLVTAQWVGSALGVVIMYFLSQRIVPRHALALLALGAVGLAWQPAWSPMLAASVIFGMGYGMSAASFNPRVMRAYGDKGASMVAMLNAAFAAGAIVAPLVFVWSGSASAPVFAGMAVVLAGVWLLAAERRNGGVVEGGPAARPSFRLDLPILGFGVVGVGVEASLIGLGPTALVAAGETEAAAAGYLSAFFVLFLAARIVLSVMAHRVPAFAIFLAAMAWTVLCALAAIFGHPGWAFVAQGLAAGMFFPGYYVTAAQRMGEDPRVTPVILSAGLIGGIGSPFLAAGLMGALGDRGFFWLLLGVSLPTTLVAMALFRRMGR